MKKHVILVPTDFTTVADCATEHAITIAKTIDGKITLLHVVGKKEEVEGGRGKVELAAKKIEEKTGITTLGVVRVGNIFDDIGDAAAEEQAKVIVMGTHGVKGFQHITGSYALKVIGNSSVPFIVVQEKKPTQGYKDMVVPLDMAKQTKQKLKFTVEIARYFGSKIHLLVPNSSDPALLSSIKQNLVFAKKYLKEHNIEFDAKIADDSSNFRKSVVKYATANNVDMISIMNTDDGSKEQMVLTNEAQIPVMCINPASVSIGAGGGLFS